MVNLENKKKVYKYRHLLEEPSIIGQLEQNAYIKENVSTRGLLVSPVQYQQGIASFGIYILYHLINMSETQIEEIFSSAGKTLETLKEDKGVNYEELKNWYEYIKEYRTEIAKKASKWRLERGYYSTGMFGNSLKKEGLPQLYSWETFDTWESFDWIGFSMYYEPQLLNMISMIKESGIPLYSKNRGEEYPLIIIGGVVAYSSEPVADMADVILVGDGEEQLPKLYELIDEYKELKKTDPTNINATKEGLLKRIANEITGAYVPKYYNHVYNGLKTEKIEPIADVPFPVKRAILDFKKHTPMNPPIIPNCEGVLLGANSYESSRGCPYSCRFCMSSYTHKPYREFNYGQMALFIDEIPKYWGLTSVKPYSFNITSHNEMRKIMKRMVEKIDKSVGAASQRVDTYSHEFSSAIRQTGIIGATIAFEAGSQRLRDVINKEISEEQILDTCKSIIDLKYVNLKMYTMSNLPTETHEDREEMYQLLKKIREYADEKESNIKIRITTTLFNAKPFTPFQWADCSNFEDLLENEGWKSKFNDIGVKINSNLVSNSRILTQVLNRADRRFGKLLEKLADMNILYIDGDIGRNKPFMETLEQFITEIDEEWDVAKMCGLIPDDWIFPYEVIDTGVTKEFLLNEWHKAQNAQITTSCHTGCTNCGVCTRKEFREQGAEIPKKIDNDIPMDEFTKTLVEHEDTPVKTRLICNTFLNGEARYMPSSKLKVLIRTAFEKSGIKVKDTVDMISEVTGLQNYSFGKDIITLRTEEFKQKVTEEELENINKYLEGYIKVLDIKPYNFNHTPGISTIDSILYSFYYDENKIGLPLPEMFNKKNIEITLKERKKSRRVGSFETVERDVVITEIKSVPIAEGIYKVYMEVDKSINPNDLFITIFEIKQRRLLKTMAIKREEIFKYQDVPSVLYSNCKCGNIREHDAFGKPLDKCIECKKKEI